MISPDSMNDWYHARLDLVLPARSWSSDDAHRVGLIDGMLAALVELNSAVNHGATFGFVEVGPSDEPARALRELFADRCSSLLLAPLTERWDEAVRAALTRIAIAENPWGREVGRPLGEIVKELVSELAQLFGGPPTAAYKVCCTRASGGAGVFGYLSDETFAFVAKGRLYVLGVGWSD
jgi:hypothetical protein